MVKDKVGQEINVGNLVAFLSSYDPHIALVTKINNSDEDNAKLDIAYFDEEDWYLLGENKLIEFTIDNEWSGSFSDFIEATEDFKNQIDFAVLQDEVPAQHTIVANHIWNLDNNLSRIYTELAEELNIVPNMQIKKKAEDIPPRYDMIMEDKEEELSTDELIALMEE